MIGAECMCVDAKIDALYEMAHVQQPEHIKYLENLFYNWVRAGEFVKMQQLANRVHKTTKSKASLFWLITTLFLQSRQQTHHSNASNAVHVKEGLSSKLALATMRRAYEAQQVTTRSELELYLAILQHRQEHDAHLRVLESVTAETLLTVEGEIMRRKIGPLSALGLWEPVAHTCVHLIDHHKQLLFLFHLQ